MDLISPQITPLLSKPTTFCVIPPHPPLWNSQKFMFALPGNPVSALVTFQLFALPALKLFAGYSSTLAHSPRIRVKITHDIERLDSRPEFLRAIASATTTITHNVIEASAIAGIQRSSRLASMCRANVLLALPAADTGNDHQSLIKAGEEVEAVVVDRIGF